MENRSWIAFHVTDRCQLNCDHCLRDPGLKATDLSLDIIRRSLADAQRLLNIRHAALTGGEPTLHPKFFDIIDAIAENGFTWHMVTNTERFENVAARLRSKPERWESLITLNFSLDGATEETHDGIRGEGNFRKVMQACAMCLAHDKDFVFQMAVNARNVHEVDKMAMLAGEIGAQSLYFAFTQPTGTFLDRTMYLSLAEWNLLRDRIARLNDTFTFPIHFTEAFPQKQPFFVCSPWKSTTLHINHEGKLNICCQHAGIPSEGELSDDLADLNETSLAQAHQAMMAHSHKLIQMRLKAIENGELEAWDQSTCNWCLKIHGKPHWTSDGIGGPTAVRQRWRGAWKPGYKSSHVEAGIRLATDGEQPE